jgi:ABC-type nitrate/sulfonate/bicarbonate transport system ATPase subunit
MAGSIVNEVALERAPSAIEMRAVSKDYRVDGRTIHALRGISLSVAPGEFVSLIGPSGCGKSTLLRLLAGLESADGGILLENRTPICAPSLARGIVFQDHRLLPWLTVEQNIMLSLRKLRLDSALKARIVRDLIALVNLDGFEQAYPHQLSGGMSQRAAIARGLAPSPRLLLLDEPFGALDSLTRRYLQGELLRIWKHEKITMLMVTHDVEEAVFLSDRVVVLEPRPGRIRQIVDVRLPKPRDRADPAFVALKEAILRLVGVH